jgi:uncharacterized GH25 family protein
MMPVSSPSRRGVLAGTVGLTVLAAAALAHDMFLKPSQYFVAPNALIPTVLLNGTFDKSSNSIDRSRLLDISLVGPAGRSRIDTAAWDAKGDTSRVTFQAGAAGTYVLGVSTKPSAIELDAKDFIAYLKEDGLPDELARRETSGEANADAHERYAKHVKSIVQVGDPRTQGYATVLGYPAEIVPLENPYALGSSGTLRVRILVDGTPVGNQYVVFGGRTPSGGTIAERNTRSGPDGVASIAVTGPGVWYVKFINMRRLAAHPEGITHESKWATLTFGVR